MYKCMISIGFNCAVAASLRRYGLRNRDYPFDWGVSTMKGVLAAVKEKFADFLDESWITEIENGVYYHNKYEYNFVHDFQDGIWNDLDFESQLQYVKEKYRRKICNFLNDLEEGGALFIRFIQDLEEARYIAENLEYVKETLRIGFAHNDNSVVWIGGKLVAEYFKERAIPIYEAEIVWEDGRTGLLFDRDVKLKQNLLYGQIDSGMQVKNLLYEQCLQDEKYKKAGIEISVRDKIFRIVYDSQRKKILKDRLEHKRIAIYGANSLGTAFGGMLINMGMHPVYYLDKYKKKAGTVIWNKKVIRLNQAAEYDMPDIIIMAIPYEGNFLDVVRGRLNQIFSQSRIEGLGDFLDEILDLKEDGQNDDDRDE